MLRNIVMVCCLIFLAAPNARAQDACPHEPCVTADTPASADLRGTQYRELLTQSMLFLGVQTGFRLTEEKTRMELKGPFFNDWFRSAASLNGWNDGNKKFTNWIAHPMGGSVTTFIFAQNNRQSQAATLGWNRQYAVAKSKQMFFAFLFSECSELGPVSESSIGNVGLHRGKQAYIDHVLTPTLGTAWSIGEDVLDARVIRPMLQKQRMLGMTLAVLLNPTRSLAKTFAFKTPWHRE